MKNYVIAAVVIILIIGGIVWYRGNNATPVAPVDETASSTDTVVDQNVSIDASSTDASTSTVAQ